MCRHPNCPLDVGSSEIACLPVPWPGNVDMVNQQLPLRAVRDAVDLPGRLQEAPVRSPGVLPRGSN